MEFAFKYGIKTIIVIAPDLKSARGLLRETYSSKEAKAMELIHLSQNWAGYISRHRGEYHYYDYEGAGGIFITP